MKGIYKITQISTGKVYIGQSVNIDNRWNQHSEAIDNLSFHQQYRKNPKDFTFQIVEENDDYTKEDLDRLEKQYITDHKSNDPKYGFNGTAGNGDGKKKTKSTKILPVLRKIVQVIFDYYIENKIQYKKVLIIGVFKAIPEHLILKHCDVTIFTDDYDYTCEDAKIIRFDGGDDLMSKVKAIKKGEYDLIIANPPYDIGSKVIANFVSKAKESIVLAPISCYKSKLNNNYKHILELKLVDPKAFKDAAITPNLNIAKLIDKEIDQSFEEIELQTYITDYKKFYELNSHCSNYAIDMYERVPQRAGIKWDYDVNKAFAITARTAQNGVHKVNGKGAFDLDVNVYKTKTIADTPIWKHSDGSDAQAAASYIYFNSTKEKDNLVKFWYYNPLMNSLLKGLNKAGGNFKIAIPNIDWSKDRDYEHCTLDDIMKWLEEDNQ